MKEMQQANNSYSNWLWNYGKQVLKGISMMGLGMLDYVSLTGYWNNETPNNSTKSDITNLISTGEKKTDDDVLVEMDKVKPTVSDIKFFQTLQNSLIKRRIKLETLSETESKALVEKMVTAITQQKDKHPHHFSNTII